jgi:hypothetical protein
MVDLVDWITVQDMADVGAVQGLGLVLEGLVLVGRTTENGLPSATRSRDITSK